MKTIHSFMFAVLLLGSSAIAGSTTVPFTYEKHTIFVQVDASKQHNPLRFILDTGASPTVVEAITAERLHLGCYKGPEPINGFEQSLTFGIGSSPGSFVRGRHATCGGLPLRKSASKTDLINISLSTGHWIDGLLGTDFLRNKILTIDFATHTLHIEQAPGTGGAITRIIDDIPFTDRHDMVFVKVNTPKRPLVFLLDTGATRTVIDTEVVKKLNLQTGTERNMNVVGGKKPALNVKNFEGSLDGYALPAEMLAMNLSHVSWGISHHIDGILGMDFLEKHKVQIDFHTRQVHLD